jgi:hypothetical protein
MEDKVANLKLVSILAKDTSYARVGHRVIQFAHSIMIFGGLNASNDYLNSILRFNCETQQIESIVCRNSLLRESFTLFTYKGNVYLWGGNGPLSVSSFLFRSIMTYGVLTAMNIV